MDLLQLLRPGAPLLENLAQIPAVAVGLGPIGLDDVVVVLSDDNSGNPKVLEKFLVESFVVTVVAKYGAIRVPLAVAALFHTAVADVERQRNGV